MDDKSYDCSYTDDWVQDHNDSVHYTVTVEEGGSGTTGDDRTISVNIPIQNCGQLICKVDNIPCSLSKNKPRCTYTCRGESSFTIIVESVARISCMLVFTCVIYLIFQANKE
jgi:hypothetical protein